MARNPSKASSRGSFGAVRSDDFNLSRSIYDFALDPSVERLQAMRDHLARSKPQSGNEALGLLRRAFPYAPLAERVQIVDEVSRRGF